MIQTIIQIKDRQYRIEDDGKRIEAFSHVVRRACADAYDMKLRRGGATYRKVVAAYLKTKE